MPAKKKEDKSSIKKIVVEPINKVSLDVNIMGLHGSPLVFHQFDVKMRTMMLLDQLGVKIKHLPKDPELEGEMAGYMCHADFLASKIDGDHFALPTFQVKKSCVNATTKLNGVAKTDLNAMWVEGEFTQLYGDRPIIEEKIVKIGPWSGRVPDLRYRPVFYNWGAKLRITIIPAIIDEESVVNLLNLAGTIMGIGEARPERQGQWGMFRVVSDDEWKKAGLKPVPNKTKAEVKSTMDRFKKFQENMLAAMDETIEKTVKAKDSQETKAEMRKRVNDVLFSDYRGFVKV
jgi:hypothetical protein